MAMGDQRGFSNNNSQSRKSEPTYYSNLRPRNYESHMAIGISFSSGLMNISIQKENDQHRYDDLIKASLPPKKATILLHEMAAMEASGEDTKAYGVVLGLSDVQTAVAFQTMNGVRYLRIAKVNTDGSIQDQKTYEFANGVDTGIQWSNFDSMKFTKEVIDNIDYTMLKAAIEEFARGQSGAYAYGGLYMNRYSESSLNARINAIMDKMGIERQSGNSNYQNYSNNGYFNNNSEGSQAAHSEHKSYSSISDMIGDDDE